MTNVPQTHYARSADGTTLAYQVSGDGPLDLMILGGAPIPIDLLCEDPGFIRVAKRLGAFSRTVWFEARGAGASEGDFRDALVDEVFDADLIAVLDAVGCEQVALVGRAGAGGSAIQFSVTHPERVSALVLVNSFARYVRDDDHPWGIPLENLKAYVASVKETWGTGAALAVLAPDYYADDRFRSWWARAQRLGIGPEQMANLVRTNFERDVRPLLRSISVPTLVLHRESDSYIDVGAGRYLSEHIPHAKLVVLPRNDHLFFLGDTDAVVDEIEEFLTGARSGAEGDVTLAAVLFTDIVASTAQQAQLGPREWSRLTDHHDALVRAALTRHRGREVKAVGDVYRGQVPLQQVLDADNSITGTFSPTASRPASRAGSSSRSTSPSLTSPVEGAPHDTEASNPGPRNRARSRGRDHRDERRLGDHGLGLRIRIDLRAG